MVLFSALESVGIVAYSLQLFNSTELLLYVSPFQIAMIIIIIIIIIVSIGVGLVYNSCGFHRADRHNHLTESASSYRPAQFRGIADSLH